MPGANPATDEMLIRPQKGWKLVDLGELWRYRELLWILALRDIQVRYKQTIIGVAWALIQPLMMMLVFTVLFTLLGQYPLKQDNDLPYAIWLYCGLLPWQLFANALSHSSESLIVNQQLITKVYFPRIVVPLAPILSGLLDFALAMVVLFGMMVWYAVTPTWHIVLLPLWMFLAVLAALSVSLWLSALNALYRDFRYVIPFVVQLGFFVSPVIYETGALKLPPHWASIYAMNPMVGVLEGFRWSLLGGVRPAFGPMVVSTVAVFAILVTGLAYFRRMERLFADRV